MADRVPVLDTRSYADYSASHFLQAFIGPASGVRMVWKFGLSTLLHQPSDSA
jgi:hypothetical protein